MYIYVTLRFVQYGKQIQHPKKDLGLGIEVGFRIEGLELSMGLMKISKGGVFLALGKGLGFRV